MTNDVSTWEKFLSNPSYRTIAAVAWLQVVTTSAQLVLFFGMVIGLSEWRFWTVFFTIYGAANTWLLFWLAG